MADKAQLLDESGSNITRNHLEYMAAVLDEPTKAFLSAVPLQPGHRCLDVGAGAGTITRWLADRVGPTGTAIAVDTITDLLDEQEVIEVVRHDITKGLPEAAQGPFDLIHARIVLMHLENREEVFQLLVDALAPGGWLVLADFPTPRRGVVATPDKEDAELYLRIQEVTHDTVVRAGGISFDWAETIDFRMTQAGLREIHTMDFAQTYSGGSEGAMLTHNYIVQLEEPLLQVGFTRRDLARCRRLLMDEEFRGWFYNFVCSRGQKAES